MTSVFVRAFERGQITVALGETTQAEWNRADKRLCGLMAAEALFYLKSQKV